MNKLKLALFSFMGIILLLTLVLVVPNSLGHTIKEEARARGYLEYTPLEARKLAETRCSQCHELERIAKYCRRCGPPFMVVISHMRRLMLQKKQTAGKKKIIPLTKVQEVAVVQAWNAMVGNWESDFRRDDMLTMLGKGNDHLIALLDTPVAERKIESGLNAQGIKLKGAYEEQGVGIGKN